MVDFWGRLPSIYIYIYTRIVNAEAEKVAPQQPGALERMRHGTMAKKPSMINPSIFLLVRSLMV
jgi:hypothetical protein